MLVLRRRTCAKYGNTQKWKHNMKDQDEVRQKRPSSKTKSKSRERNPSTTRDVSVGVGDDFGATLHHGAETVGAVATLFATINRFGFFGGKGKRAKADQGKWPKLLASVIIDAVGISSYAIPGIGESEDVVWAPISAALIQLLYGSYFLTAIDLVEEGLPFTDVIPTACIAWALEYTQLRAALPFMGKKEEQDRHQKRLDKGGK